jgi:hypothetical protein
MHYSSNRLFVLSTFIPRYWQDILAWVCCTAAGIILLKGAVLDRLLRGGASLAACLALIGHDVVALYCAAGCFLFYVARSSLLLNLLGVFVAPQLAILSRALTAAVTTPAFGTFTLIIAISFGISFFAPDLVYPAYPPLGHVVPTYGVLFHEAARIGFAAPIDLGNLQIERSGILVPGLVLLVGGVLFSGDRRYRAQLFLLGLVGVFDALVPGHLAYLSPLRAILRLVPSLSELPILSIFLGLGVPALVVCAFQDRTLKTYLLTLVWIGLAAGLSDPLKEGARFTLARSPSLERFVMEQKAAGDGKMVDSPSLYPLFLRGARFADPHFRACLTKTSLGAIPHEIDVSANSEQIPSLYDGRRDTRWTTGGGHQLGSEWLSVRFKNGSKEIVGIQLMTGEFLTDFARGLEVSYSPRCSSLLTLETPGTVIFHEREWQGELAATSDGYPYFKEERYTQLLFDREIDAQCLLIRQIAKASYDWSVTDLRFIEKPLDYAAPCEPDSIG